MPLPHLQPLRRRRNLQQHLTVIIDNNGLQIDGRNDEVMSLGDLPAKLRAFGCDLHEIDGHDLDAIAAALDGSPYTISNATDEVIEVTKK